MSGLLDLSQSSWPALCAVACGLGARHALDADHISVIDGIARRSLHSRPAVARLGGVLFSIGHCVIVALATVTAVKLAATWQTPAWLEISGTLVTVAVLLTLAVLNLRAAWRPSTDAPLAPVGWKTRMLGDRVGDHPLIIVGVGALFAMSFDTIAQAAAIGFAANAFGGLGSALAAASFFALGMILVGGANGVWIVALLRSTGTPARTAARLTTGAIGLVNLAIGLLALSGMLAPTVSKWTERSGLLITAVVLATVCLAFLGGGWRERGRTKRTTALIA